MTSTKWKLEKQEVRVRELLHDLLMRLWRKIYGRKYCGDCKAGLSWQEEKQLVNICFKCYYEYTECSDGNG